MRCNVWDAVLTDAELKRKYPKDHPLEGQYVDICNVCLASINDIAFDELEHIKLMLEDIEGDDDYGSR